ncbi:bifunctional phosphopantothenoylcysteine decarboxylase/phosphopantothenate--cysteine ligase CoaBC [Actinomyces viscosus]|uniref:Coenzyme A biosynthesis bifunctional protein CoaBC n=1 Tax=Actinomyces viscosus TaxID=1656 RepID=A0A3S4Z0L6_ACTVI|nr:bifunctional phosphopantothenoylcysteine decarboxylase/phosphopantothenate--cysteine ligase CoaBC [Actinomyces viscosus]TFH53968.1 bifunctional phosphopantothenoylcysteine decarboxylase/phosphopantothenate--cysteine ligase CoaBC [Actinomyces viscosus]VEI14882.1 DNA/pantothenate metabolism flavoprotein [Actinomyces viscosus]
MDELHTAASERAATAHPGPRRVVVGVAGSIAAYKAPFIIRLLRQAGHEVKVVATESALRFIGAPALAAVSGQTVSTGVFDDPAAVEHVAVAEWADLVLVAPASADLLARVRAGRADDMLTATILTSQAPVILAPAMHTQMWLNPATRDNVSVLRERGLRVIEPDSGRLTGKDSGLGRLPEPEQIVSRALAVLQQVRGKEGKEGAAVEQGEGGSLLKGRHVVVSAGGTREPIDPVRYLGNRSSGRQGLALAVAAVEQGARVTLVQAHVASELLDALPPEVTVVTAGTAHDMLHAVREAARDADAVIMAAAVADYRPVNVAATKIKKQVPTASDRVSGPTMSIELTTNPDILAGLVSDPPRAAQVVVGFAAETGDDDGDALFHGRAKARRKGAHLLAVNAVGEDLGFGDVPNAVVVLDAQGSEVARGQGSKTEVARLLISLTAELVNGS